jgi:hypothetical protein
VWKKDGSLGRKQKPNLMPLPDATKSREVLSSLFLSPHFYLPFLLILGTATPGKMQLLRSVPLSVEKALCAFWLHVLMSPLLLFFHSNCGMCLALKNKNEARGCPGGAPCLMGDRQAKAL